MRRSITCALLAVTMMPLRSIAGQNPSAPVLRGTVRDAQAAVVPGVSVRISPVEDSTRRSAVTSSSAGRFQVRLARYGAYELVARRPGFATVELTLLITTDTATIDIAMTRLAQPLNEVTVRATELERFAADLRRAYKGVGRSRVFDARQLDKSGQLLAGAFLFGQGGIQPVACRHSGFLPDGKVRTEPVEREPNDLWWPCYMSQGKAQSIMIRIDGGPLEPFDAVKNRALADFAALAVVGGGFVIAYTKDYAASKRRELNAGR